MAEGWIKLHRKMIDWEWFADVNTTHLFLYLLLKANHKDSRWRGTDILRGQLVTGREALARETGLSEQQIRTSLKKLQKTKNVTIKPTSKFSLLTIDNYEEYQSGESEVTSVPTNNQPTSNQQVTTNKNENNNKNKKNSIDIVRFEEFWELYGIKKGRSKCEVSYTRAIRNGVKHESIMEGLRGYQSECIKKDIAREYIKNPLTWLNGKHWDDEYERKLTEEEEIEQIKRNIGEPTCATLIS